MRNPGEQKAALECLRLAAGAQCAAAPPPHAVVERAAAYLAFVTGQEEDDAKRKLDAVLAALGERSTDDRGGLNGYVEARIREAQANAKRGKPLTPAEIDALVPPQKFAPPAAAPE